MAIVSMPLDEWQIEELRKLHGEGSEREYRFSTWPDGSVTVDDGDTVYLEFSAVAADNAVKNQRYWNAVCYLRGYEDGNGWEEAGKDVPDPFRADAKDAYDLGCGDFAEDLDPGGAT